MDNFLKNCLLCFSGFSTVNKQLKETFFFPKSRKGAVVGSQPLLGREVGQEAASSQP